MLVSVITFSAQSIKYGIFSRRDPCKSCQSYSFLYVGVLD